jgi:hypothetical protein
MHAVRTGGLLAEMVRVANAVAGTAGGELTMLSHRSGGGAVIRVGAVVVKAHPPWDDPATLAARLRSMPRIAARAQGSESSLTCSTLSSRMSAA